jgi:hypothetical protein
MEKENPMNKWKQCIPAALTLAVILPLVSCADFFTNSWGKNFARDPSTVTVSSGNVKDLLKEAKGDTDASRGILNKIADNLKGNPKPDPNLQRAAITAANQASGLGQLVLENVDTLTKALSDSSGASDNVISDLLDAIEDGAKDNKIPEVAQTIGEVLKPAIVNTPGKPPKFDDKVVSKDTVPTSELILLTTTMILAEADKANLSFNDYVESWSTTGKKLDNTGTTPLNPSEQLIAALVNELGTRSDLGGNFQDMFGGN